MSVSFEKGDFTASSMLYYPQKIRHMKTMVFQSTMSNSRCAWEIISSPVRLVPTTCVQPESPHSPCRGNWLWGNRKSISSERHSHFFRPDSPSEIVFSCRRKQGAILYLPTEARCENTVALGDFGDWMIKHIDSWFPWVRRLGVGIERMEDIVLVTGTHRTRSWTNVAFPGGQTDGLVSFGANVATRGEVVTINWKFSHEYTRGAVLNYGPNGEV